MKKISSIVAILLIGCLALMQLCGCGIGVGAADLTEGLTPQKYAQKSMNDTFYTAQTAFSLSLFQTAVKEDVENLLLSPLSVTLALGMAVNGAEGKTGEQMLSVLGGHSKEELNGYLASWARKFEEKKSSVHLANSVWIRKADGLNVKHSFLQDAVDFYHAGVFQRPFNKGTVQEINQWVKKETNGMIPSLLEEISPETMLYLINALAFEAEWERPYEKSDVKEETFTVKTEELQRVQMMKSHESQYIKDENAIGFLRPYKNGEYTFGALLPREDLSLENYISGLTAKGFYDLLHQSKTADVLAYLPKFENDDSMDLSSFLIAMGMSDAFSDEADFSSMAQMELHIGQVVHKTHIEVDEKGTKAAAVTGVYTECDSEPADPPERVEVRLDRPFMYFILDCQTGLPIFMGTVTSVNK